jgi:hypothetical protein
LCDKYFFINKYSFIDKELLEIAWEYSLKKISNDEIINDASVISVVEIKSARSKYNEFHKEINSILFYLNSYFDVTQLKLKDENIERRFRQLLAKLYLDLSLNNLNEINKSFIQTPNYQSVRTYRQKRDKIKKEIYELIIYNKLILLAIGVVFILLIPRIIKGLTTVDILTEKIYVDSKRKFNGARCKDGYISHSQGRGTCSWHDSVDYYFFKGDETKTYSECRDEAFEMTWLD